MTAPIVPPYLTARARVAVVFARRIARAEQLQHSPLVAELEALRDEVLDGIDPVDEAGIPDVVPFDSIRELELRNLQRGSGPDAEWAIAMIAGAVPLDVVSAVTHGAGAALWRAGYEAFFRQESGFRVLYARRTPPMGRV